MSSPPTLSFSPIVTTHELFDGPDAPPRLKAPTPRHPTPPPHGRSRLSTVRPLTRSPVSGRRKVPGLTHEAEHLTSITEETFKSEYNDLNSEKRECIVWTGAYGGLGGGVDGDDYSRTLSSFHEPSSNTTLTAPDADFLSGLQPTASLVRSPSTISHDTITSLPCIESPAKTKFHGGVPEMVRSSFTKLPSIRQSPPKNIEPGRLDTTVASPLRPPEFHDGTASHPTEITPPSSAHEDECAADPSIVSDLDNSFFNDVPPEERGPTNQIRLDYRYVPESRMSWSTSSDETDTEDTAADEQDSASPSRLRSTFSLSNLRTRMTRTSQSTSETQEEDLARKTSWTSTTSPSSPKSYSPRLPLLGRRMRLRRGKSPQTPSLRHEEFVIPPVKRHSSLLLNYSAYDLAHVQRPASIHKPRGIRFPRYDHAQNAGSPAGSQRSPSDPLLQTTGAESESPNDADGTTSTRRPREKLLRTTSRGCLTYIDRIAHQFTAWQTKSSPTKELQELVYPFGTMAGSRVLAEARTANNKAEDNESDGKKGASGKEQVSPIGANWWDVYDMDEEDEEEQAGGGRKEEMGYLEFLRLDPDTVRADLGLGIRGVGARGGEREEDQEQDEADQYAARVIRLAEQRSFEICQFAPCHTDFDSLSNHRFIAPRSLAIMSPRK